MLCKNIAVRKLLAGIKVTTLIARNMWVVLYDSKNRKSSSFIWDKCRNCHKILASNNIIVMSIKQSSVITICFKNLNWFPIHAEDDKKEKSLFSPQDMWKKFENTVIVMIEYHPYAVMKNKTLHKISTWMNRKQSNFWNWDGRKMYSLIKKKFIVRIQPQKYKTSKNGHNH